MSTTTSPPTANGGMFQNYATDPTVVVDLQSALLGAVAQAASAIAAANSASTSATAAASAATAASVSVQTASTNALTAISAAQSNLTAEASAATTTAADAASSAQNSAAGASASAANAATSATAAAASAASASTLYTDVTNVVNSATSAANAAATSATAAASSATAAASSASQAASIVASAGTPPAPTLSNIGTVPVVNSTGTAYVSSTPAEQLTASGVFETYSVPNRPFNTTFTNSKAVPIFVSLDLVVGSTAGAVTATVAGNTVSQLSLAAQTPITVQFIVPAGATYGVSAPAGALLGRWVEC